MVVYRRSINKKWGKHNVDDLVLFLKRSLGKGDTLWIDFFIRPPGIVELEIVATRMCLMELWKKGDYLVFNFFTHPPVRIPWSKKSIKGFLMDYFDPVEPL
jgi:hypothetical protein